MHASGLGGARYRRDVRAEAVSWWLGRRFSRSPTHPILPNPSDVLLQRYDLLPRDRNYMQAIEKNEFHEVDSIEAVISQMLYIEAVISLRCYI